MRQLYHAVLIFTALACIGLILAGCDVHAGQTKCVSESGIKLEGSDDCEGLERAYRRCEFALSTHGFPTARPAIVDVEPSYHAATGKTSAGTTNYAMKAIVVLDDNWCSNAFCHEMAHLGEGKPNPAHTNFPSASVLDQGVLCE